MRSKTPRPVARPRPQKGSRWRNIGLGCLGILALFMGIGIVASLSGDGERSAAIPTFTSTPAAVSASDTAVPPTDTPASPTQEPPTPQPAVAPAQDSPTPETQPVRSTGIEIAAIPVGVPDGAVEAQLVNVVDGDTIDVMIGGQPETIRYIGIDTPERGQPGYDAATEANRLLLGSGSVYLASDQTERDRYGRLLRYVYAADGTFVDHEMVAQGWAQPVEYPPDLRHAAAARAAAVEAAQAGRGFWSGTSPHDGAMSYGITTSTANIRRGPGTDFEISGAAEANTPLTIYGRNQASDWFEVRLPTRDGGWISAELVRINVPVEQIRISAPNPETSPPVITSAPPTPLPPVAPVGGSTGSVEIANIFFDGAEPDVEGDEYVIIRNTGSGTVNLAGWRLNADDDGQDFWFPAIDLAAGQECRVYTNRSDPNTCGLNFGSDKALWANGGECGHLYNPDGVEVSTLCYQ